MTTNTDFATGVKGDVNRGYLRSTIVGVDDQPTPDLTTDWEARNMPVIGLVTTDGWSSDQSSTSTPQNDFGGTTVYVDETDFTDEFTITFMGLDPEAISTWLGADNVENIAGGYRLKFGTGNQAPEVSIAILNKVRSGKFDFYVRRAQPSSTISRSFSNDGNPIGTAVTFTALYNDIDGASHVELIEGPSAS